MKLAIFKALQKVKADRKEGQRRLEKAYREMESQLAYQEALEERSRRAFVYGDMQDLLKVCQRGVNVTINFADGTNVKLVSADPLEEYANKIHRQGEFF